MSLFEAKLERFRGRRALVLGMGRSGVAACGLLAPVAEVTVWDVKPFESLSEDARDVIARNNVTLVPEVTDSVLRRVDLVVRSPGVPWDAPPVVAARRLGPEIIGELELAYRLSPSERIIAVTGSNGKSTTTAWIGEILQHAGADVRVAGNIGLALGAVVAGVDRGTFLVCEVSSFQLEDIVEFRPGVGVLLNLAPDHLDRHRDVAEYYRLKWRIFENQTAADYAVLNADDGVVAQGKDHVEARVLSFGHNARGGPGVWVQEGEVWARVRDAEGKLLRVEEIGLAGPHNVSNGLAAAAAALAAGVSPAAVASGLRSFRGLPHRLEDAGTVAGVRYVNDSKATNVASAIVALQAYDAPIILIAGGRAKGEDFRPLARAARGRVRRCIFYGEAKGLLAAAFDEGPPYELAEDIPSALTAAAAAATPGDVVLLAPACTSWDQYPDYEARGDDFKRWVAALRTGAAS